MEYWIGLYLDGYELEWSYDKKNWFPLTKEPYAGDNKYYRKAVNATHPISKEFK